MAQIRIIAGDWKGRRLAVPDLPGLRPTADRNRETLFNWLQFELAGRRVLDAFAGTGSLGLEALSRGASSVVFWEHNRQAVRQLKQNLSILQAGTRARVQQGDALRFINTTTEQFDLIFLDPPFRRGLLEQATRLLSQSPAILPDALIYLEAGQDEPLELPAHWQVEREKVSGQVRYQLCRRL